MTFVGLISNLELVAGSLSRVTNEANSANRAVGEATANASGIGEFEALVSAKASQTREVLDSLSSRLETSRSEVESTSTQLQEFLELLGSSDSPSDRTLLANINAYLAGLIEMSDLTETFRGISTAFEGELQAVNRVLQSVLPSTSEIQQKYRSFLEDIRGQSDELQQIVAELENTGESITDTFAGLIQAVIDGGGNVQDLILALENLRRLGLSGSEAGILGTRAADLLRKNRLKKGPL